MMRRLPMVQVQVIPLSNALSAKPDDEPGERAERHHRDHRILAELGSSST
jgi:hypothetical protein